MKEHEKINAQLFGSIEGQFNALQSIVIFAVGVRPDGTITPCIAQDVPPEKMRDVLFQALAILETPTPGGPYLRKQ